MFVLSNGFDIQLSKLSVRQVQFKHFLIKKLNFYANVSDQTSCVMKTQMVEQCGEVEKSSISSTYRETFCLLWLISADSIEVV